MVFETRHQRVRVSQQPLLRYLNVHNMPKRKHACTEDNQQARHKNSKKAKQKSLPVQQEVSEPNSDESHRTEQLLHRGSVTPPRRQPVRTRRAKQTRAGRSIVRKALEPPVISCSAHSNSEEESDIFHYNPDTALYYPGTDLVIDGWFQPCRYFSTPSCFLALLNKRCIACKPAVWIKLCPRL